MDEIIELIISFYSLIDDFLLESDNFLRSYTNWQLNNKDSYNAAKLKELMKNAVIRGTNNE